MPAIEATIDFDPDTLNLTSNRGRWVTCYIELPEEYDAGEILCDTVMLNGVVACEKSGIGDYDKDGIPDMMVKFDREHVASLLEPADEVVITVGGMAGSVRFVGTDVIRVIDEGTSKERKAETPVMAYAESAPDNAGSQPLYYFHCDHLGTPQAITDENGNIVWKADYKPFGEVSLTTAAVENNFRFPGQYFDEETGLHYNWFRYYDPKIGRYLRSDPVGVLGDYREIFVSAKIMNVIESYDIDINLYGYAGAGPVNWIDPFGLGRGGERGATGGSSGQNSKNKYKHCRNHPTDPNKIRCRQDNGLISQSQMTGRRRKRNRNAEDVVRTVSVC